MLVHCVFLVWWWIKRKYDTFPVKTVLVKYSVPPRTVCVLLKIVLRFIIAVMQEFIRYDRVCSTCDLCSEVSKLLNQGYSSRKVQDYLFTNLTPLCHICWRAYSPTLTYDWFQLIVNRDGCHMWGSKCSLFPEQLISLPLGSSWFHPFIIYTLYITELVTFRTV